ncbi:MAG: hypothetical protein NTY11_01765 [Candidatus Parcubacteria bacterium]|nr:hypothetical protein [Candidatus Parcubacteria bacterium]
MIKAIFFDIGDVLIHNSFNEVLQGIAENLGVGLETLKRLREEYNQELTTGEMLTTMPGGVIFKRKLSTASLFILKSQVFKKRNGGPLESRPPNPLGSH